jgi:hypothetical protein
MAYGSIREKNTPLGPSQDGMNKPSQSSTIWFHVSYDTRPKKNTQLHRFLVGFTSSPVDSGPPRPGTSSSCLIPSKRPQNLLLSSAQSKLYKGQIKKTSRHIPQLSSRREAGDIVRIGFSEVLAFQDALTHLADLIRSWKFGVGWLR